MRIAERIEWIDLLRFIAIISVVIIHSQGAFIDSEHGSENWWIFNIINSFCHFSVPVFVMISGALLLKKRIELIDFIKKRFTRILFPFLFWSIILFIGNRILERPLSSSNILTSFLSDLQTNNINNVYWFLYMLIGLYLIAPILSVWLQYTEIKQVKYFILIWVVTLFINVVPVLKTEIDLKYFSGFIGYFVLGNLLSNMKIEKKVKFVISLVLIIVGTLITIMGNFYFEGKRFEAYLTPNIMILSVGIFLFFKDFSLPQNKILAGIFLSVSKYSYGIYLIHAVYISLLSRIGINCLFLSPYIGSFVLAIIVTSASFLTLYILNLFPLAKYITGA